MLKSRGSDVNETELGLSKSRLIELKSHKNAETLATALWKQFQNNIPMEIPYFKAHCAYILLCTAYLAIFAGMINRNLAYYRHIPSAPLRDLGFEIIPELPLQYRWIPESMVALSSTIGGIFLISILFLRQTNAKHPIRVANIALRTLAMVSIGHFFRLLTMFPTSLPGPAPHCQATSGHYNPPQSLYHALTTFNAYGMTSCGDLLFSGHEFYISTLAILMWRYSRIIYNRKWHYIVTTAMAIIAIIDPIFIVAARNHYSVDIVVAIYFSFTLFIVGEYYFPNDLSIAHINHSVPRKVIGKIGILSINI